KFGTGIPDGLIASEAANNASIGGAFIPLVALGIPGDAVTEILLGGFMIHGINPGPLLFRYSADLVYAVFGKNLLLPFSRSSAMASHSRDDERLGALFS
ncbi:tripartite tricarboxylate transporter permease, partial [Acetomicrobium sp. S15 = DSM 107314]|uniref:tripartite tricarboxylate transporter permease n=1 Tax=Acetomicrobium sp. S15 = DSM 107314 TaxID=2529858 RepID=UPI0018E14D75